MAARSEMGKKVFKVDTLLVNASTKLQKQSLLIDSGDYDKDKIRMNLRMSGIYDYNIEVVKIDLPKKGKLDLKKMAIRNKKLYEVLNDTLYNKVGYVFSDDSTSVNLVFTQNCIEFFKPNVYSMLGAHISETGVTVYDETILYVVLRGINICGDSAYYSIDGKNTISIYKDKPVVNPDNKDKKYFEVIIKNPGKPIDVEFTDSFGQISAVFLTPYFTESSNALQYPGGFNPFKSKEE